MTNADKIRQMSDEELAKFIADEEPYCDGSCAKHGYSCNSCVLEYIVKESEE